MTYGSSRYLEDPFQTDYGDTKDDDSGGTPDDPRVVVPSVQDDRVVEFQFEKILEGVAEADNVHGTCNGVRNREHESDGATELRSKRP